jgi:hypothetical protein
MQNETSRLRAVVWGTALVMVPSIAEAYDPKSVEHILAGTVRLKRIWWLRWRLLISAYNVAIFMFN